jgi:Fungal specific transcription factor domain
VDNISGYFELAFWDYLVLQASCTESCVRYALLALSSLHESLEIPSLESQFPATEKAHYLKRCPLSQYTRAIGLLTNGQSTEQPTLQVILICCLIFIWLEFLQDNLDTALGHLKSGLQLLHENRKSSHSCYVDESVARLLTRLHTQATIHGSSTFGPSARETTILPTTSSVLPQVFRDIFEARRFLDIELSRIFLFHRKTESPAFVQDRLTRHPFPDPLSLQAICQSHLQNLQQWYAAFYQMDTFPAAPSDEKQQVALAQLQIQYLFVANTLQTLFTASQMIYDRFYTDFERILSLAETLILSNHKKFYIYAFDMGVLTPLLYLILKCGDLGLRSKAIELLKRAPPREGMWERESVIEIAEWKVRTEEKGRGGLSAISALPNCAKIYAESATEKVVDGRKLTVLRYRRGATDLDGDDPCEKK